MTFRTKVELFEIPLGHPIINLPDNSSLQPPQGPTGAIFTMRPPQWQNVAIDSDKWTGAKPNRKMSSDDVEDMLMFGLMIVIFLCFGMFLLLKLKEIAYT